MIIIDSPGNILKKVKTVPSTTEWHWCYFGVNMNKKREMILNLPASRRTHYSNEIYAYANEMKQPFLDWMAEINSGHKNDFRWWANRLPSKSIEQTDFYLLVCYFRIIKNWCLERSPIEGTLLIAIDDPFLLKMLNNCLKNHDSVRVGSPQMTVIMCFIFTFIKMMARKTLFLLNGMISLLSDFKLKNRYKDKFHNMITDKPDVLIYTWVEQRSFDQAGRFKDVYLGELPSIYRDNNCRTVITAPYWLPKSLKDKALKLKEEFVVVSFFLRFRDYLKAVFTFPLQYPERAKRFFLGDDYSHLFTREILSEISSSAYMGNLCEYYGYRNYFNSHKDIKLFIYPFENQPWEKVVLLAMKHSNVHAKSAAYQHSTVPKLLLCYFLGKNESKSMPLPDCIVTNGKYYEDMMSKANYNGVSIVNGGSLRYKKYSFPEASKVDNDTKPKLLIILPCSMERAMEMIYDLYDIANRDDYEIFIRPHPDLPRQKIHNIIREMGEGIKISDTGDLAEILPEMNAVVHAGSTAAIEAYYNGLEVFKYKTEFIDMDRLSDHKMMQKEIERSEDVPRYANNYKRPDISTNILNEDVNKNVWRSLINNETKKYNE